MAKFKAFIAFLAAGSAIMVSSAKSLASTVTLDTVPSWNGSSSIASFGSPNTATYGETFTTPDPSHTLLNDFSFRIATQSADTLTVRGEVYQWDSTNAEITGTALFESSPFTISGTSFNQYVVSTGSLSLASGTSYVAFLTVSKDVGSGNTGASSWGFLGTDGGVGALGKFVFNNNGSDFGSLSASSWSDDSSLPGGNSAADLAVTMHFSDVGDAGASPVPLPPAFLSGVLGLGLLALTSKARRFVGRA